MRRVCDARGLRVARRKGSVRAFKAVGNIPIKMNSRNFFEVNYKQGQRNGMMKRRQFAEAGHVCNRKPKVTSRRVNQSYAAVRHRSIRYSGLCIVWSGSGLDSVYTRAVAMLVIENVPLENTTSRTHSPPTPPHPYPFAPTLDPCGSINSFL